MSGQARNETKDAADALAAYALTPPLAVVALSDASGINNRIRIVRTGAGTFIWKTYLARRDVAAIRYEHRLLTWLAGQMLSFTTPRPIPTRAGDTLCRTPDGAEWQALFTYLPGRHLDRNDPALIEA